MDLLLAFSLAFFIFIFCALCIGRAVLPVYGAWIMVVAKGNGEDLWQRLYALMWLRHFGFLHCPVYILDDGLTEEGLNLVAHLITRWPQISLCEEWALPEKNTKETKDGGGTG